MSSEESDSRISAIEIRLNRIEALLPLLSQRGPQARSDEESPARAPALAPPPTPSPEKDKSGLPPPRAQKKGKDTAFIGNILGWGGAIALVLAAAYLIRLAVDSGWLTPVRQVGFAAIFGIILICSGLLLRKENRQYAGLLPAAGIAILFLSIYGGHLYHHVIGLRQAGVAVIVVCAASLWLCKALDGDLYALFAVAGSYSAPFLLSSAPGSLTDLAIYFSAWGVVFCVFAVWHGRRLIYLLALYLGLIGFDLIWQSHGGGQWVAAVAFQTAQFAIFGIATAVFSVRRGTPLDSGTALAHLPPLLLFYFLQYNLLDQHLPALAPWIAVGSLAIVGALYGIARASLQQPLPGGELLLWCYAALVLFHAGYIESVPREWAPWAVLLFIPVIVVVSIRGEEGVGARWPIWWAVGIILVANYLRIIFDTDLDQVPGRQWLAVAYAVLLYFGYWLCAGRQTFDSIKAPLLYLGHVSAMTAALRMLDEPIVESAVWGLLAISCLILSLRLTDKPMGQSSLAIFGATAVKVLLSDLGGAPPVARIVVLVVLGVTFYFGGLLYQRLLVESAKNDVDAAG